MKFSAALAILAASLVTHAQAEPLYISQSNGELFAPGFRGQENTSYYGWSAGTFDSNPTVETGEVFNDPHGPAPSLGALPGGAGAYPLTQAGTTPDILSSSNNIYVGAASATLNLTVYTSGVNIGGYTTIIIQGISLPSGNFGSVSGYSLPSLGQINGVAPVFYSAVTTSGANSMQQWWAKYEIAGSAASYDLQISLVSPAHQNPISINGLTVDTSWSSTGYSADVVVPEPSTYTLLALGVAAVIVVALRRQSAEA